MIAATHRIVRQVVIEYGIVLALVLLTVILSFSNQYFLTANNLIDVFRQVSINGILAVGMTFVILTAGIDLSVGSLMALTGMVAASLVSGHSTHTPLVAALAAIGVGTALGGFSGGLIAWARLSSFVVTLGMLSADRGLTLIYSNGMPISDLSPAFKHIGDGRVLGIPVPVLIFAATVLIAWITLRHTVYGRWVYAVGGNIRSARISGIPTGVIIFSVYALMGALSGLAGVVLTARTTAALPQAGVSYELDAIAAVVIGGTSLFGGYGSVVFTVVGVLIIGFINDGLDLMGVSTYYQLLVKGLIIVAAVLIDRARHREGQ